MVAVDLPKTKPVPFFLFIMVSTMWETLTYCWGQKGTIKYKDHQQYFISHSLCFTDTWEYRKSARHVCSGVTLNRGLSQNGISWLYRGYHWESFQSRNYVSQKIFILFIWIIFGGFIIVVGYNTSGGLQKTWWRTCLIGFVSTDGFL